MLKLRSVRSIVIAPASTGREVISKKAVIPSAQTRSGIQSSEILPEVRHEIIVVKKLIDPRIEEIPAIWSEKIAKSTEIPEWNLMSDNGG